MTESSTIQDLQERLWDISDKKKIEAEEEKQSIVTEQWLEDHIGLLTNHYIQLLQVIPDLDSILTLDISNLKCYHSIESIYLNL